jgi:hypothetical protein
MVQGESAMLVNQAESLRKAIETLIDAKLFDALARPGGLDRLAAYRSTGVVSHSIRSAEQKLEQTVNEILQSQESYEMQA